MFFFKSNAPNIISKVPNLTLHLDVTDDRTINQINGGISQWNDKSGNGYHVTQGVSARRPTLISNGIGGKQSIKFVQSSSQYLKLPSALITAMSSMLEHTLFIVHKMAATSANGGQTLFGASHSAVGSRELLIRNAESIGGAYTSYIGRNNPTSLFASSSNGIIGNSSAVTGDSIIVGATSINLDYVSGTRRTVFFQDTLASEKDSDVNKASWSDLLTINVGYIGANEDSSYGIQWELDGEIAEIVLYDRALNLPTEITPIFNYLKNKYGI